MRITLPLVLGLAAVAVGIAVAAGGQMGPTGDGVWVGLTNGYRYEVQEQSGGDWSWWRYDAQWDIGQQGSASSKAAAATAAIATAVNLPPAEGMAGIGVDSPLVPRCDEGQEEDCAW